MPSDKAVHLNSIDRDPNPRVMVHVKTKNTGEKFNVKSLPDTGTTQSIIDIDAIEVKNRHEVIDRSRTVRIYAANKTRIPCLGTADIELDYFGKKTPTSVLVAKGLHENLLISTEDQKRMGILHKDYPKPHWAVRTGVANAASCRAEESLPARIQTKVNKLFEEFPDVFGDDPSKLPPMKGPPMKIQLKSDVPIKPTYVTVARKTPIHQEEEEDRERNILLKAGIIREVTWPTRWISPSAFIPKPGNPKALRLVTDLRGLNRYIERPVMPFPTPADILARIPAGATLFCKLDMVKGYYQVPLDKESADLTTFLLPQGRYQYTRGVMGCCATNDEFVKRTDVMFAPVKNLLKCIDDLLVAQVDEEVFLDRIREVLEICRNHGITLSRKKMQTGRRVLFAGYIISDKGIEADPAKLAAIRDFQTPSSRTELKSFMGLAVQITSFQPDQAHILSPFAGLLKAKSAWCWLPEHTEALKKAKEVITAPPILSFFDPKRPTILLTDAARIEGGLGFALTQTTEDGRQVLIQCGSRRLTSTESRYSTIESEALAIQWAVKKCRTYLFGAPFRVFSDHKPLRPIFNTKSISDVENPRLQRIMQKLAGYQFVVEFVPGKRNLIADALSRAPVFGPPNEDDADDEAAFTAAVTTRLHSEPLLDDLREAALADMDYQLILSAVEKGTLPKDLPPEHPGRQLKSIWHNLAIEFDLLIYDGLRIVVPEAQRQNILRLLHKSHSGIVKTRAAARTSFFWPGINEAIKNMVDRCDQCQRLRPSQREERPQRTTASRPMESISADLYHNGGKDYLLVIDRYSGWPWAFHLRNTNSQSVTNMLDEIFFECGFPSYVRTDGGPQFRGHFEEYCKKHKIKPELSSPYNPQSNGHAEAGVKAVKYLLQKHDGDWEEFRDGLREYRNTPRGDGISPAMLFFGRTQRTWLPRLPGAYKQVPDQPRPEPPASKNEFEHNPLEPGTRVRIQHVKTNRWDQTGTIVKVHTTGRSYFVDVDDEDVIVWRNRRFLKPLPQ